MAITLQSFSNLFGHVNDGDFVLKGEGEKASLQRVNRGQSAFTRAIIYKQVDLTTDAAKADNLRTRQALRDALVGSEDNAGYARYIEEKLGLNDETAKSKPLKVRDVKILIDRRADDMQAHADAPRHDEDGYTIVNGVDQFLQENPQNGRDLAVGLQGQAVEQPIEVEEAPVETQSVDDRGEQEDPVKTEITRLKDELKTARDQAKGDLAKVCSAYIDELVRELDKGFLVTIDPEDATKTVKVPVDERTRDLLKLSLDKNKADYYDDQIDNLCGDRFSEAFNEETEEILAQGRFMLEEDQAEDGTDPRISSLNRKIDEAKTFGKDQDTQAEVKTAIASRLTKLFGALTTSFAKIPKAVQSHDTYANMLASEMSLVELPGVHDFRYNITHAFANFAIRQATDANLATLESTWATRARDLSASLGEDPALEADIKAFFTQNKESVLQYISGPVLGKDYNSIEIGPALNRLNELAEKTFRPRFDLAQSRFNLRNVIYRTTGLLDHIHASIKRSGKLLGGETLTKINDFTAKPQGELKRLLDTAIDGHLKGTSYQGTDIGLKSKQVFDEFFAILLDQEAADGFVMLNKNLSGYTDLGESFFKEGSKNQLTSLPDVSLYQRSKAEGSNPGKVSQLWGTVKGRAIQFGLAKLIESKPTVGDQRDGLASQKLENFFRDHVRNFAYRADLRARGFDTAITSDDGQKKIKELAEKHYGIGFFGRLNTVQKNRIQEALDKLLQTYILDADTNPETEVLRPHTEGVATGLALEYVTANLAKMLGELDARA